MLDENMNATKVSGQSINAGECVSARDMTVEEKIDMRLKGLQYQTVNLVQLRQQIPSHVLKMSFGLLRQLTDL